MYIGDSNAVLIMLSLPIVEKYGCGNWDITLYTEVLILILLSHHIWCALLLIKYSLMCTLPYIKHFLSIVVAVLRQRRLKTNSLWKVGILKPLCECTCVCVSILSVVVGLCKPLSNCC